MVISKNNFPTGPSKIQSNEDEKKDSSAKKQPKRVLIKKKTSQAFIDSPDKTTELEVVDELEAKEVEVLDDENLPEILDESDESVFEDEDIENGIDDEELFQANEPGLVAMDALQRYLSELRRYPLLSREEERQVAMRAFDENDIQSRNTLVTANLRLVVKIAMEYRRAYSQILDLIQEGNAGLVQAVNRFNPYRGVKLSTYSAWWIRAYILKFLMDNKSLVRMGTTDAQRKLFFRLRGEAEKMYALTQKFDAHLLAEKIGVQEQDVIEMQQRLTKHDLSLDTPVGEDGDTKQVDLLSSHIEDADTLFEKKQLVGILNREIEFIKKELNERDFYIFYHRIMSDEPITLQEVGEKFGVTRERARQLEARVIKKIKDRLVQSGILK
jgi:RNA polymerase sigma-32 factor